MGMSAIKPTGLATTFTPEEVVAAQQLFSALQLGKDMRLIARNREVGKLALKFRKMGEKLDRVNGENAAAEAEAYKRRTRIA